MIKNKLFIILLIIIMAIGFLNYSYATPDDESYIIVQSTLSEIRKDDLGYIYVFLHNIPISEKKNVEITVEDESIAKIDKINYDSHEKTADAYSRDIELIVKGLKEGSTKITANLVYNGNTYTDSFDVNVIKDDITEEKRYFNKKIR